VLIDYLLIILKAHSCQNCIYAIQPAGDAGSVLVCTNKADSLGQLHYTEPGGCCRNFQPRKISRRQKVPLSDVGGAKYIPLTQGKFAIIDADDYERLARYKWYCHRSRNKFYAYRNKNRKAISMHREVLRAPKDLLIDHVDGNSLNNRKNNLRLCTYAQNAHNRQPKSASRSKYKGLSWHRRNKKWEVSIIKSARKIFVGSFDNETEAAVAYDRKAEQLFGEFAYLNFLQLAEFRKFARKIIFAA